MKTFSHFNSDEKLLCNTEKPSKKLSSVQTEAERTNKFLLNENICFCQALEREWNRWKEWNRVLQTSNVYLTTKAEHHLKRRGTTLVHQLSVSSSKKKSSQTIVVV